MAGGGGGGDGEPEFQIAPMIDVLLVLLVFFVMITSAEVLKVDKNLTLPISPNAKQREPEMAKHEMAVIVVRGDAAVPAGEIQKIMNLIGEAGIADIAFASSNK
jgi:biopolymer transport protein ExbD